MGSPRCGEGDGCLQGSRLCEEGKGMKEEFGCRLRCSGLLVKGKKKGKVGEVRPGSRLRGRGDRQRSVERRQQCDMTHTWPMTGEVTGVWGGSGEWPGALVAVDYNEPLLWAQPATNNANFQLNKNFKFPKFESTKWRSSPTQKISNKTWTCRN
jgi:hypothetical protein